MGKTIEFKREKTIHFANYNEDMFFKDFSNFSKTNYNIKEVAKKFNIEIRDGISDFPEESKDIFGIIEVKDKNNIRLHLNEDKELKDYHYDTVNSSIAILTDIILPNIQKYHNQYILIGKKEMIVKSFFKKHYSNPALSVHKDISFHLTAGSIKTKIKNFLNRKQNEA